jgi:hypothetical protein
VFRTGRMERSCLRCFRPFPANRLTVYEVSQLIQQPAQRLAGMHRASRETAHARLATDIDHSAADPGLNSFARLAQPTSRCCRNRGSGTFRQGRKLANRPAKDATWAPPRSAWKGNLNISSYHFPVQAYVGSRPAPHQRGEGPGLVLAGFARPRAREPTKRIESESPT